MVTVSGLCYCDLVPRIFISISRGSAFVLSPWLLVQRRRAENTERDFVRIDHLRESFQSPRKSIGLLLYYWFCYVSVISLTSLGTYPASAPESLVLRNKLGPLPHHDAHPIYRK